MCRSIKVLRVKGQRPTEDEVTAAALQFVRKISGFRKPSRANQEAFDRAVSEIAQSSKRLLEGMVGVEQPANGSSARPAAITH
jgi:hypothetical protein